MSADTRANKRAPGKGGIPSVLTIDAGSEQLNE